MVVALHEVERLVKQSQIEERESLEQHIDHAIFTQINVLANRKKVTYPLSRQELQLPLLSIQETIQKYRGAGWDVTVDGYREFMIATIYLSYR